MKLLIESPTKAYLLDYTDEELQTLKTKLTYTNKAVQHLIKRHHNNYNWKQRGFDGWNNHLEGLKKDLKPCLVFQDQDQYYIRPGSIPYISDCFPNLEIESRITYPTCKKMAWKHPLPFELHPEQETSWKSFIEYKHSNVSLTTGLGKSAILLKTCQEMGLNTCIVVPSKSIFEELLDKFTHHFGKKYVGTYGAGKKNYEDKRFVIAIGDSLANIKPESEEFKFFNSRDVLMVDESHEFAAESLEEVCHGVLANIPYRFFLSATQLRNDGSLTLLQSIIGKTVCELETGEAVSKGYICPHDFRIISVESSSPSFQSSDALESKREHFLRNTNIASFSARLSNAMATQGKQTLILVSELSQIAMLAPLLKVPFAIAHSETNKARLEELKLFKVDNAKSVEAFNKNEVKVLVGTGCIATGTNIYPCHSVVNWVGGSSPIKTKQGAVGRAVRFGSSNPWASKCLPKDRATIYDFDVTDQYILERHLETRIECYKESGPDLIKYIKLKHSP